MTIQPILDNLKIETLNQMQEASIAATKKGNDIIVLAPTGSGKTLAFLLPVLHWQYLRKNKRLMLMA